MNKATDQYLYPREIIPNLPMSKLSLENFALSTNLYEVYVQNSYDDEEKF